MHPNARALLDFYEAFDRHDGAAMVGLYAPHATFSDPVFTDLRGEEVGAMWQMLVGRAHDLRVEVRDVVADDARGTAHWTARYTFARTKRAVVNEIDASFEFVGGRVTRHVDSFDLWAWTRMALGPPGALLGWGPLVRGPLRRGARAELEKFMARRANR